VCQKIAEWWKRNRTPISHAAREVVTTSSIALLPVWAGVFLSLILQEVTGFWPALIINTARGDLFLLAAATMAPLTLYLSVRRGELPPPLTLHFPAGWFFIACLVLLFGTCSVLFAIKRIADLPNATIKIDHELFLLMSFITYVLSIVLSLFVTTIKNSVDAVAVEDVFRANERDALDKWKRRPKR
jgi:hypothetical protein